MSKLHLDRHKQCLTNFHGLQHGRLRSIGLAHSVQRKGVRVPELSKGRNQVPEYESKCLQLVMSLPSMTARANTAAALPTSPPSFLEASKPLSTEA